MAKADESRLSVTANYDGVTREFIPVEGYESYEVLFATMIVEDMKLLLCERLANNFINMMNGLKESEYKDIKQKQALAKEINRIVSNYGLTLVHPETHEECVLFAVSDHLGGKWTLENRTTKKRSMTTRLPGKVPFVLRPLPLTPPDWSDFSLTV